MMTRIHRWLGLTTAILTISSAAWAGPFEDAAARYKGGDYQGALALLQQAEKEQPKNPHVYAALGQTYQKLNDPGDAKSAYDHLIQIDPNLSAIKASQRSAFARAYQAVGGDPSQIGGGAASANTGTPATASGDSPQDIISDLASSGVYIAPGLREQVDGNALAQAVSQAKPRVVKIAVVGHTGSYPTRDALADDLRKRLNVPDDGVVLVATPNGVSGSSARLSRNEIDKTLQSAGVDAAFANGGLTNAATTAVGALTQNVANDNRKTKVNFVLIFFLLVGGILAYVLIAASRKKQSMGAAKGPIETLRQKVIADFTYVDGYLDLLPAGAAADNARASRASAYERLATANGVLQVAKTPGEIGRAQPLLAEAQQMLTACRAAIDQATGGTGVVISAPETPSLQTDAERGRAYLAGNDLKPVESVASAGERDRLQQEINAIPANQRGVSFFSGRPMPASELTPVTMVIGGQKRTVMATRDEAAAIARGETPNVRAFADATGRYTPWYEYRGYDPYRDYYGGWGGGSSGLGTLVDLYVLTNLLGPATWGGYGPWGYGGFGYGMPMPVYYDNPGFYGGYDAGYDPNFGGYTPDYSNNGGGGYDPNANSGGGGFFGGGDNSGYDPAPSDAGGVDFFGQNGSNDPGPGFDTSPVDNGGGGFDFGGGNDGGGGGFDFGGGGDSGGGFDSGGGGDFGGGDFGGGGDSGGF